MRKPITQIIEAMTNFQEIHLFYDEIAIAHGKAKGKTYTKKELNNMTANWRKRVKSYYDNRDKKNPYIKLLKMTPLMYWLAFKRALPKDHANYDKSKDILEIITNPLLSGIARLDKFQLVIKDKNSITIFSPGIIRKNI